MTRLFLLRLFESYFRRRWLYLFPIVLATGAGFLYIQNLPPKYLAKGILYINDPSLLTSLTAVQNNNTNWWLTPAQATSNEINELVQTDAFIRAVINGTDLEQYMNEGPDRVNEIIAEVRKSVWIFPVGNNELSINASINNPQVAYQLVHSVINSYVNWQINTKLKDSQVAKNFFTNLINDNLAELEAARQRLKDYYEAHPLPVRGERPIGEQLEITRLQNEVDLALSRYQSVLRKEEDANLAMIQVESDVRHTYVLLDAPILPEKPDFSRRKMALLLAQFFAVGVLLSVFGIAGGALLDRSFRYPADVQYRLSLPVLAVVLDTTPTVQWYRRLYRALPKFRKAAPERERPAPAVETVLKDEEGAPQDVEQEIKEEVEQKVDLSV